MSGHSPPDASWLPRILLDGDRYERDFDGGIERRARGTSSQAAPDVAERVSARATQRRPPVD